MKNTIAGASFILASTVCIWASVVTKYEGDQPVFLLAWLSYVGLGLYFFLFADKFSGASPNPHPEGEEE